MYNVIANVYVFVKNVQNAHNINERYMQDKAFTL